MRMARCLTRGLVQAGSKFKLGDASQIGRLTAVTVLHIVNSLCLQFLSYALPRSSLEVLLG